MSQQTDTVYFASQNLTPKQSLPSAPMGQTAASSDNRNGQHSPYKPELRQRGLTKRNNSPVSATAPLQNSARRLFLGQTQVNIVQNMTKPALDILTHPDEYRMFHQILLSNARRQGTPTIALMGCGHVIPILEYYFPCRKTKI